MNRLFYLNHASIDVHFSKNSKDFVVTEVPLYEFSGEGEHLILKVRKKDLTTWGMIQIFSEISGAKVKEFGYAGLKDKDGMTVQNISILKKYEKHFEKFEHPKIKILEKNYHNNKIKTGHLKGNRFFIRLKKVNPTQSKILLNVLKTLETTGFANYFGYQRFGKDGDNFQRGKAILKGEIKERNKKMRNFFISAYQSHLYNLWLSKRVEISKLFDSFDEKELFSLFNFPKETISQIKQQPHFFKILPGELMHHYPHGRLFLCEDLKEESNRFFQKQITPTGLLAGKRAQNATGLAGNFEKDITKECETFCDKMQGTRRFAWIWAQEIESLYKEELAWFELNFTLPKGSYATTFLEELTHKREF